MKKVLLLLMSIFVSHMVLGFTLSPTQPIKVSNVILSNSALPFLSHNEGGPFGKALAMNVAYEPVKALRLELERRLGYSLKIFKGWNSEGEAHITTITPPEFTNIFSSYIGIQEIDSLAVAYGIQSSDILIEGVGRGTAMLDNNMEETYFIIIKSEKLLKIRREIHRLFISRGGNPKAWDPDHFYPHITIGFTKRDLHEQDSVIKDKAHSLDLRFVLELESK
jgi:hypothetical protein